MQAVHRFHLEGQGSVDSVKGVPAEDLAFPAAILPRRWASRDRELPLGRDCSRCGGRVSTSMPQLEHCHPFSPPAWACILGSHSTKVARPTPDPHAGVLV